MTAPLVDTGSVLRPPPVSPSGGVDPGSPAHPAARGYWADGDHLITRDGQRLYRPVEAQRLRDALTKEERNERSDG